MSDRPPIRLRYSERVLWHESNDKRVREVLARLARTRDGSQVEQLEAEHPVAMAKRDEEENKLRRTFQDLYDKKDAEHTKQLVKVEAERDDFARTMDTAVERAERAENRLEGFKGRLRSAGPVAAAIFAEGFPGLSTVQAAQNRARRGIEAAISAAEQEKP